MKKKVGSALVVVLLLGMVLPVLGGNAASVHACCLAGGAHHCSESAPAGDETVVISVCPHRGAQAVIASMAAISSSQVSQKLKASSPVLLLKVDVVRVALVSSADGRAPPASRS
ncbi:MAG TPA: hypothetical protein VGL89_18345 [Candidatus Koribacter sp.]